MSNIVEKIEAVGVKLQAEGDKLVITGKVDKLTTEQVDYLRAHKPAIITELQTEDDRLAAMRKSQPGGWGWWGFLLQDGGQGSIRGPYRDRESALAAVVAEFNQPAIKLVPLPGSLPEPEPPSVHTSRVETGTCKPPIIECRQCRQWTPDSVNPSGGMGRCAKRYPQFHYPWSTCKRGR